MSNESYTIQASGGDSVMSVQLVSRNEQELRCRSPGWRRLMALGFNCGTYFWFLVGVLLHLHLNFAILVNCQGTDRTVRAPVLYWDGKTLAEVFLDDSGNMIHCRLHELEEVNDAIPLITNSGLEVRYPSFQDMLRLINNCTRLEKPSLGEGLAASHNITEPSTWLTWPIWNGIMPGTKWCGVGDIANSFAELGTETELDACCRAHDHCPIKLKAFRTGYGIINLSLYTRSHCDCDGEFFWCLKRTNNPKADMVGNVYFNIMQVKCMKELRPEICKIDGEEITNPLQCQNLIGNQEMHVLGTQFKY